MINYVVTKYSKTFVFCDRHQQFTGHSFLGSPCIYQWCYNAPGTELLDVVLTGNVATELCKYKLLLVQAVTELIKVKTSCHVVIELFLGSAQQKLTLQSITDNLQLWHKTYVTYLSSFTQMTVDNSPLLLLLSSLSWQGPYSVAPR